LLGSPVKNVTADLRNIKNAGDAEDHVQLLLTTESGLTADVTVSTAIAVSGVPRWILAGKYGSLSSNGTTTRLRYFDPARLPAIEAIDGSAAPNREYSKEEILWIEKELPVEPSPLGPPHQNILDVLLGHAEPVVSPESAAEVVRVTELALCAAAAPRW
jgi:predicted dehydrogenase